MKIYPDRWERLKKKISVPGWLLTVCGFVSLLWNQVLPAIQNVEWLYSKLENIPVPALGWSWLAFLIGLLWLALIALWPEKAKTKDFSGPFLTLHFPIDDLLSTEIRTDYLFIKNLGQRAALDVELADISRKWGGNVYTARFPRLQLLEGGESKPVTPTVYRNGDYHAVFSINSRVWFCALLIGEQKDAKYGAEILHNVSVSYTDQGVKKTNSMVIAAKWTPSGVLASVRNQT